MDFRSTDSSITGWIESDPATCKSFEGTLMTESSELGWAD
jgi:hypothetical protein